MRKLIAGFMTALIALLTATSPVLAAAQLGSYPTFLAGTDGTLGTYVVVGSTANPVDVVGAIDLATRLAEVGKATTSTSCSGSSAAVNGVSKDTVTIQRGFLDDFFPGAIRSFHTTKLTTGTFSWASNNYDYYEDIQLGSDQIYTSHDFSTTGINGTQSLVVPTNVLKYRYVFKKALNLGSKTTAKGTATAPEYSYPININLLGKPFQIVGLGTAQVVMLSGSIGTATATTPVVSGDYSAYSDLGSDASWARVIIKDKTGNTVDTLVITSGSDKTSSAAGLTVKVTAVRALQDGTIVGTDLVIGPTNNIEKTYPATCDISGTGTSDFKFPGETEWCIQATGITTGNITVDDAIEVVYKPTTTKYIKSNAATPALALPNSYGYLGFIGAGFNYDSWMTLTFTPKTGLSAYWDEGMTGASNSTLAATNLNGIEISSDVAGSLVNGTNGYNKAYILFNYTLTNTSMTPVMVGFWDSVNNRIAIDPEEGTAYYRIINGSTALNKGWSYDFNFTLSYSNGAASADKQYLFVNVSSPSASSTVNGVGTGGASVFGNIVLGKTGSGQYNNSVLINYVNKTATWSATSIPEFRLFSTSTAEAKDVQIYSTDVSGIEQKVDVGVATQDVVTDAGDIIVTPNAYSGSDIVKVKVPAQVLFAKLYIGSLTSGTAGSTASYTSYPSIPVVSAVAKLDTEVKADATLRTKNLVVVGGPCVNQVAADALGVTYPACGASSTVPQGAALIKVVNSPYTEGTGKSVLVVAGWEADNTRAATSVLQQYESRLAGVTASSVTVSGTVGAPTVTPS